MLMLLRNLFLFFVLITRENIAIKRGPLQFDGFLIIVHSQNLKAC